MNPKEYQKAAARTECDQEKSLSRMQNTTAVRLCHASIGMCGEVGEVASEIQKWIYYGQGLNRQNLETELGDLLWYIAEACNVLEVDMGQIMEANIAKLRTRYPDKYTDDAALEQHRDRTEEAKAIRSTSSDFDPDQGVS